ncbi:hypothetical protein HPB52_009382 [Rhipicephalus sanguineus]|uniref:Uncharacterized protein n=1 Tax=Rhipicephalus sanguineus TaxID=34632 RepID=A0A9D4PI55_RHISA|nr:hypothetical protein HPB52_009382 [Rhipicephalus sanguineus]
MATSQYYGSFFILYADDVTVSTLQPDVESQQNDADLFEPKCQALTTVSTILVLGVELDASGSASAVEALTAERVKGVPAAAAVAHYYNRTLRHLCRTLARNSAMAQGTGQRQPTADSPTTMKQSSGTGARHHDYASTTH